MIRKILFNKNNVALAVGLYDTAVGLWPLLSMSSYSRVTRLRLPFVAKPIGASWALLGIALLLFSGNRKVIPVLGTASTVAGSTLAFIQCLLVATRIISPVFLIQAAAESIIGLSWIATLTCDKK